MRPIGITAYEFATIIKPVNKKTAVTGRVLMIRIVGVFVTAFLLTLLFSSGASAQSPAGIQGNVTVMNGEGNPVPVVIQGVDGDVDPDALQVELVATFNDGSWDATPSVKLSIESGKTAVFEYISCNMSYGFGPSGASTVTLYVDTINPDESLGTVNPYRAALESFPDYTPAPFHSGHASGMVSACIGEKCTGLDGTQYPSLYIDAERDTGSSAVGGDPGQEMKCTIFGSVY